VIAAATAAVFPARQHGRSATLAARGRSQRQRHDRRQGKTRIRMDGVRQVRCPEEPELADFSHDECCGGHGQEGPHCTYWCHTRTRGAQRAVRLDAMTAIAARRGRSLRSRRRESRQGAERNGSFQAFPERRTKLRSGGTPVVPRNHRPADALAKLLIYWCARPGSNRQPSASENETRGTS
jgi:hypothetical protein